MTIEEVLKYYKTGRAICNVLNIRSQNFTQWRRQGYIPIRHQMTLERLTQGELKTDSIDPSIGQYAKETNG